MTASLSESLGSEKLKRVKLLFLRVVHLAPMGSTTTKKGACLEGSTNYFLESLFRMLLIRMIIKFASLLKQTHSGEG